jgi:hypothetical protein
LQVERGKPKCAKYWPDVDKSEAYGKFRVHSCTEKSSQDYTLREFTLKKEGNPDKDERRIFHYHFQASLCVMLISLAAELM